MLLKWSSWYVCNELGGNRSSRMFYGAPCRPTHIQSDILQKNTILISGDPETEISIFEKVKLSKEHEIQRRSRDKIC